MGRGTCTEEHRQKVMGWLTQHPQVTNPKMGKLTNCWYGDWDDDGYK
jgi:uncharacterized protein YggL (DUF469 family)